MLINLNRKVLLKLLDDEELVKNYIKDCIISEDKNERFIGSELEYLSNGMYYIINKNENIINKYGLEIYENEEFPAKDETSGFYYTSGKLVIIPFDWSLDENKEFDYSFQIAELIDS